MMKTTRIAVTVLAFLATWSVLQEARVSAAQVPLLQPAEAFALIQANRGNPQFVILDVRTPEEFREGHLEGAINIDINADTFKDEVGRLDRQKTYLVYCRTGRRSNEAVRIMGQLGFTHLLRLDGDIVRWQAEKLPVVK